MRDNEAIGTVAPPGTGDTSLPWRRRIGLKYARARAYVLAWRRRMYATRRGRISVKIAFGVLGALVIGTGILLLPLPGPGWLIILAGLGLLAMEFTWARRLLAFVRDQLKRWTSWVREGPWWRRGVAALLGGVVVAGLVAGAYFAYFR